MPRLIISSPQGRRGVLELTKPVITVGRSTANDLVLNDASVSRLHAVIKLEDDAISIADRGSTNGIVRNGDRIEKESELHHGDIIQLGEYELRLEKADEKGIQVRRAEWPSTLDRIMRGEAGRTPLARPTPESPADLAARVKKLERENYLLTVLYEAGKAFNSKLSVNEISRQVITLASMIQGVERGFVMLFNESGEAMQESEVMYRNPAQSAAQPQIMLSKSVLDLIRKERQAILIDDLSADERFSESESLKISGLRSAMCAPLLCSERLLGLAYVDNMDKPGAFTQEELNVFSLLAAQAGAAIDNAVAHRKIAQQAEQRLALERFVAPEVAEMIAANPEIRLGGVNQKVSVMFTDIRGFTQFSERTEPHRVVEILNEYFTRVTDVILDHGGMIDKYIGDAVMAVFGVPISKRNDAENAVQSAIQIQRLIAEMNRDAARRGRPDLAVGIGINTGVVTAGNIGSPSRLDYTVVGDAVNIASRLMANAEGGQILISQPTAADLKAKFELHRLRPRRVRGRSEPVQLFSVEWNERGRIEASKRRLSRGAAGSS